jgi:hypothetical protein
MYYTLLLAHCLFCADILQANPAHPVSKNYFRHSQTQGDKFIDQLLEVIKSNDKTKAQQFVVNNYCDPCLHFTPVQSYTDVIVKLQSDFNQYAILQRKSKGYKAVVLIKSDKTNQIKLISLEVDKNDTQKIFKLSATDFTGKTTDTVQL